MSIGYNSLQGAALTLKKEDKAHIRCIYGFFTAATRFILIWYNPTLSAKETLLSSSGRRSSTLLNHWVFFKDGSNVLNLTVEFVEGNVRTFTLPSVSLNQFNLICVGTTSTNSFFISVNGEDYVSVNTIDAATPMPSNVPELIFIGGEAAKANVALSGVNQTRNATLNFCTAYLDDIAVLNAQPTTAMLKDVYKNGNGKRLNRSEIYTTAISHLPLDGNYLNYKSAEGFRLLIDMYNEQYNNTSLVFLDGVNDAITGEHGVDGFNITPFLQGGAFTLNAIVTFEEKTDYLSVVSMFIRLQNSSGVLFQSAFGNSTGTIDDEYLMVGYGSNTTSSYIRNDSEYLEGTYMITVVLSDVTPNPQRIYINAVQKDNLKRTQLMPSTAYPTTNGKLFLGNGGGSSYFFGSLKEIAYWKGKALTDTEITSLYNYYTSNGTVLLENTTKTLADNSTFYSDSTLIELWKGNHASNELIASKRPKSLYPTDHQNLKITGRVLTEQSVTLFVRRRGKNVI